MTLTITPQSIITASAVLGAATALVVAVVKLVHWFDRQKEQDTDIKKQNTGKSGAGGHSERTDAVDLRGPGLLEGSQGTGL